MLQSNACRLVRWSEPTCAFRWRCALAHPGRSGSQLHDGLFRFRRDPVLQNRLLLGDLLQLGFATGLLQFLETVKSLNYT